MVKSRDGVDYRVTVADNPQIAVVVNASLADFKQGSFVGVAGMPQADGSQKALEVHIFPELMRGSGEGHYRWDLRPQSTMTNATVEQTVTSIEGQTLVVKYKEGEQKIIVSPETPIVAYLPGDRSDLKPAPKSSSPRPNNRMERYPRARGGLVRDGITPPIWTDPGAG